MTFKPGEDLLLDRWFSTYWLKAFISEGTFIRLVLHSLNKPKQYNTLSDDIQKCQQQVYIDEFSSCTLTEFAGLRFSADFAFFSVGLCGPQHKRPTSHGWGGGTGHRGSENQGSPGFTQAFYPP